jgi:pyruvate formate lyase activating enzyme
MKCINCNKEKEIISKFLGVCLDCIRWDFENISSHIEEAHKKSRKEFNLPVVSPKDEDGIKCNLCVNECRIGEGKKGYCGLRVNIGGKIKYTPKNIDSAFLEYYFDPLPTNCVADWVCSGSNEIGFKNLAVFYTACSFNCLFCQNWHFKERIFRRSLSGKELAAVVDEKTYCICFFGGDPTPFILHTIETSRRLEKQNIKVCIETNGSMNKDLLKEIAQIVLSSGGCIKFDLKAFDENLNISLCGVSNKRTYENFKYLAKLARRKEPPFLVASTLLIPGYLDAYEVSRIAKFIADLDPLIPYSLLGFYPHFFMKDLPTTSYRLAKECEEAAKKAGLKRVRIGNIHLLS